uniref:C-type lectin domain-containing protein n=1 Tax=Echeneis naucrates TaxID=173247 RepID=A0A665TC85_ECHNA
MKVLGVFLTLSSVLTQIRSVPLNATTSISRDSHYCDYVRQHCHHNSVGAFCPTCDANGNFLPQQCWPSHHYCPSGWTFFEQRCFIFIDSPKTWTDAEIYCQFEGANLASIHSYEENHFVMSLTRGDTNSFPLTWIGGFSPGFWMWSDGFKFFYENWSKDQIPESSSNYCLKMNYKHDLKWFYDSCAESYPFVCVKKI